MRKQSSYRGKVLLSFSSNTVEYSPENIVEETLNTTNDNQFPTRGGEFMRSSGISLPSNQHHRNDEEQEDVQENYWKDTPLYVVVIISSLLLFLYMVASYTRNNHYLTIRHDSSGKTHWAFQEKQ